MRFLHSNCLSNNTSCGKFFPEMVMVIFPLFSWNPAGAVRSGKNPAVYKFLGETIHVDGKFVMCLLIYLHKKEQIHDGRSSS
jgi:hypothetical protein